MARGNKKQVALKVRINEDLQAPKGAEPEYSVDNPRPVKELAKSIVNRLRDLYESYSGEHAERREKMLADDPLRKLSKLVRDYEAWGHFLLAGHKERKREIIEAVNALPPEIRDYIKVPNSTIERLKRVSNHASNPDDKGDISASFTTSDRYAEWGKKNLVGSEYNTSNNPSSFKKYGPEMREYTAKDIKSVKGIISFVRFKELLKETNRQLNASRDVKLPRNDYEATDWNRLGYLAAPYHTNDDMGPADEHLVYGIKWKDGVK